MAKSEGVTIGFLGTGAITDIDSATDLIEEFIEATITSDNDPVIFVFPLTTDEFSDTMGNLVEMAKRSDITYEVITATADKERRRFTEVAAEAARTYHVADVYTQMEHILSEAPQALLEVIWDKDREEDLSDIVGKFIDAGLDVRDLTDGNVPMGENDESAPEAPPAESVVEAETKEVQPAEEEAEATEEGELPIYARSDLEKMSRADIKAIALRLGLPPRKSIAAMADEIMEAQGEPSMEPEEPAEPPQAIEAPVVTVETTVSEVVVAATNLTARELVDAMDRFPGRIHEVLDEFLTNLGKTVEGLVFNASPEQQMSVEEPARPARRLRRSH